MELRQLRYFAVVARECNFGRASKVLRVAQPALSRQIQKLEAELGAQLFTRTPAGVRLTPEALELLEKVERLLNDVRDIEQSFLGLPKPPTTLVPIGLSPGTAEILSVPLSRKATARLPAVRLRIISTLMPTRTDQLLNGEVAFALINAPQDPTGLVLTPLMREPLCLICRPGDPLSDRASVTLEDILQVPLVVGGVPASGVRGILETAVAKLGGTLLVAAEANTAGASKSLVLAGLGSTVHVAAMARAELQRGELRAIPISGLYSYRVIAHRAGSDLSYAARSVVSLVRECLGEMLASGEWLGGELIDIRPKNGEPPAITNPFHV
jgi:LysR family nitrogen assimilation transcriptional regulator